MIVCEKNEKKFDVKNNKFSFKSGGVDQLRTKNPNDDFFLRKNKKNKCNNDCTFQYMYLMSAL